MRYQLRHERLKYNTTTLDNIPDGRTSCVGRESQGSARWPKRQRAYKHSERAVRQTMSGAIVPRPSEAALERLRIAYAEAFGPVLRAPPPCRSPLALVACSLQLALLTHEVSQAARRPNFARTLCLALEGRGPGRSSSKLLEERDYLANFSRTLKLPLQHQLDLAVALAHSETPGHAAAGMKHVRAKLPELEAGEEAVAPEAIFAVLHLLRTHSDLAGPDTFASIARAYPAAVASLAVLPLLDCDGPASMNLKATDRSAPIADDADPLGILRDQGYAATHSAPVLRAVLGEAGALPLSSSTAARLLLVRPNQCRCLLFVDEPSF